MLPKLPKAIIFDWDNTLVDTWQILHKALEKTFIYMGKPPMTYEEMLKNCQYSARVAFPREFGERGQEAIDFFYMTYRQEKQDKIAALPRSVDLLNLLAGQNIYMAVVSNKNGDELRDEVNKIGWSHYFSHVIGATDCIEDKPSPLCVNAALASFTQAHDRKDVWFVGDMIVDYKCACSAGCFPILIHPQEGCDSAYYVQGSQGLYQLVYDVLAQENMKLTE